MIQMFEEFNEKSGRDFIENLVKLCKVSKVVKKIFPIEKIGNKLTFKFDTNVRDDNAYGNKSFKVFVPIDMSPAYVETYEEGKKSFTATLEPKGETSITSIFIDFIEATSLFDDTQTQAIVSHIKNIHTAEDLLKILDHS
jgi:hypothetical protein